MNRIFPWIGGDKSKVGSRTGKTPERAEDALAEASTAARGGDIKAATKLFEESIRIYHALGLTKEEASGNHALAVALTGASDFTAAFEAFSESIALFRTLSLKAELASVLKDSGRAHAEYSDSEKAWAHLEESRVLYENTGDQVGVASIMEAMGIAAVHDEEFDTASNYFTHAVEHYGEHGYNERAAGCMVWLSSIAVKMNDLGLARERYLQSIDLYRSTHTASQLSDSLAELGQESFSPESHGQVQDLLNATMTVYSLSGRSYSPEPEESGSNPTGDKQFKSDADSNGPGIASSLRLEASACMRLAPVPYSQGRRELALTLTNRSIDIARELADPGLLCQSLFQAGNLSSQNEDSAAARQYYTTLSEAADSGEQSVYRAPALFALANEDYKLMDLDSAVRNCEACLELYKSRQDVAATARALVLYGALVNEKGDPETGLNLLNEGLTLCRHNADTIGTAQALWHIGTAARELDPEYARACLLECIESEESDEWNVSAALQSQAELELLQGEIAAAFECSCRALSIRNGFGDSLGVAAALELCAHVAVEWGDIETAVILLSKSESIHLNLAIPRKSGAQVRYDSNVQKLKNEMGDVDFDRAWAEGSALTLDEIIDEVELMLEEVEPEDDLEEEMVEDEEE